VTDPVVLCACVGAMIITDARGSADSSCPPWRPSTKRPRSALLTFSARRSCTVAHSALLSGRRMRSNRMATISTPTIAANTTTKRDDQRDDDHRRAAQLVADGGRPRARRVTDRAWQWVTTLAASPTPIPSVPEPASKLATAPASHTTPVPPASRAQERHDDKLDAAPGPPPDGARAEA